MTTPAIVLLALEPLVMVVMLGITSRQLLRLERGLDHDLKQGLRFMNEQHRLLSQELRAAQQEQVQAVSERFAAIDASMDWAIPWVRYWVALHHQAGEFPG